MKILGKLKQFIISNKKQIIAIIAGALIITIFDLIDDNTITTGMLGSIVTGVLWNATITIKNTTNQEESKPLETI